MIKLKLKIKLLVIASIGVLILVIFIARIRIELICNYLRLVSNKETNQFLTQDTPTEILEADDQSPRMSVGYAEFHYPFGKITKIYTSLATVKIESQMCKTSLSNIVDYGRPIDEEETLSLLLDGTIGMWKRGRLVKIPVKFADLEHRMQNIRWMDPYAFHRGLMAAKPKSLISVLLMSKFDLYTYVSKLENKNLHNRGFNSYFFETGYIRGMVETPRFIKPNAQIIILWDQNKKLKQIISIEGKEPVSKDLVLKLLSSFRYTIDLLPTELEKQQTLILDTIKNHPAYDEAEFIPNEESPYFKLNLDEFEDITNKRLEMEQFTQDYADAIRAQLPEAQIKIIRPLELVFTVKGDETEHTCHLNNVWQLCKSSPQDKASIINHYVVSLVKHIMPDSTEGPIDPNSIIPSLKNKLYLNSLPVEPDGSIPVAADHLAGDIWITYARESEATIHFLSESDLQDLKMSMPEVHKQSIANLKNRLNKVLKFDEGPCNLILTEGGYTASLLLLDSFWAKEEKLIAGEIVASVPSRDTLFFTSTESAEGLEAIRKVIVEASKEEAYLISNTLLVRRNGKWEVFEKDKLNTQ
jgi:uncharacterized protein YtpQ (UPF0354 family)